jgi:hypothetical protein
MFSILAFARTGSWDFIILAIVALPLMFWVSHIIDVVKRQFHAPYLKLVWLLVVLVFNIFGAAIYYGAGRAQGILPEQTKAL